MSLLKKAIASFKPDWLGALLGFLCLLATYGLYVHDQNRHLFAGNPGLRHANYELLGLGVAAMIGWRPAVWLIATEMAAGGFVWIGVNLLVGKFPSGLLNEFFGLLLVLPLALLIKDARRAANLGR